MIRRDRTADKAAFVPFLASKVLFITEINTLVTTRTQWCTAEFPQHSVNHRQLCVITKNS